MWMLGGAAKLFVYVVLTGMNIYVVLTGMNASLPIQLFVLVLNFRTFCQHFIVLIIQSGISLDRRILT